MTLDVLDVIVSLILLFLGIYCFLTRSNIIKLIIGIQILTNAVNLSFISTGWTFQNENTVQTLVIIILLIDVIITAVAMAIMAVGYKHGATLDIREFSKLKW